MASGAEMPADISSVLERLERNRDMSLFLPFLIGLSEATPERESDDPDHETRSFEGPHRQRIILVNPFTQGMVVIDGGSGLEALFRELANGKGGRPPASKESIEALESVEIGEEDSECVVCLEEFGVGGVAKEMPCKHRFHGGCIEKWLGMHGTCPVCRYEMPVEEIHLGKKREEEGGERRNGNGNGGGEVWVSFSFNRSRRGQDHDHDRQDHDDHDHDRDQDQDQAQVGDSNDDSSLSTHGDGDAEES